VNAGKPILAALVIFAAGVVPLALTLTLRSPPFPAPRGPRRFDQRPWLSQRWEAQLRELAKKMENHLELTPEQRQQVEGIVRDSQNRMRGIWD